MIKQHVDILNQVAARLSDVSYSDISKIVKTFYLMAAKAIGENSKLTIDNFGTMSLSFWKKRRIFNVATQKHAYIDPISIRFCLNGYFQEFYREAENLKLLKEKIIIKSKQILEEKTIKNKDKIKGKTTASYRSF